MMRLPAAVRPSTKGTAPEWSRAASTRACSTHRHRHRHQRVRTTEGATSKGSLGRCQQTWRFKQQQHPPCKTTEATACAPQETHLLAVVEAEGVLPLQHAQHVQALGCIQVQQQLGLVQLGRAAHKLQGQLSLVEQVAAGHTQRETQSEDTNTQKWSAPVLGPCRQARCMAWPGLSPKVGGALMISHIQGARLWG